MIEVVQYYYDVADFINIKQYTKIPDMARAWAMAASKQWGGSMMSYLTGPEGTMHELSEESTQALAFVKDLQSSLEEARNTYEWKNDGGNFDFYKDPDKTRVRNDFDKVLAALKLKMSEGTPKAMALRLYYSMRKIKDNISEITQYIEYVIYADYEEDHLRVGVEPTKEAKDMLANILKAIEEA